MERAKKIIGTTNKVLEYISVFLIFISMGVVAVSVIMRILFKAPIAALNEIVQMLTGLIVASSLSVTESRGKHLQVDFIREYFPKKYAKLIYIFTHSLAIIVIGLIVQRFYNYTIKTFQRNDATILLEIPFWLVAGFLTIGLFVFLATMIVRRIDIIINWEDQGK